MLKTSIEPFAHRRNRRRPDPARHALSGMTMGTRWSALIHKNGAFDTQIIQTALQAAVDEVDQQMSLWKPDSGLTQLNATPVGQWIKLPQQLMTVLSLSLSIGAASDYAFDIGVGDAVTAWGFGPTSADPVAIRSALGHDRPIAAKLLDLDPVAGQARKAAPACFDLNGIAKGYAVDRLAETLQNFSITTALVGIDGEMRALGCPVENKPWTLAIEAPHPDLRAPYAILELEEAAVATSGDYRHWLEVGDRKYSHTMDPRQGAPLQAHPASVTVVAATCAEADAWATALMVLGAHQAADLLAQRELSALFLTRTQDGIQNHGLGPLFSAGRLR